MAPGPAAFTIDLPLKLIDYCIKLVKEHDERKVKDFSKTLAPLFAQFGSQHQVYMASFQTYRDLVKANSPRKTHHPVFDAIEKDHVFNQAALSALGRLSLAVWEGKKGGREDPTYWFVNSIVKYFTGLDAKYNFRDVERNIPRLTLAEALEKLLERESAETIKELAKDAEDDRFLASRMTDSEGTKLSKQFLKKELVRAGDNVDKLRVVLLLDLSTRSSYTCRTSTTM